MYVQSSIIINVKRNTNTEPKGRKARYIMSYLTEQKTELAQAQVTEALLRMSKLQIHSNAIKEFLQERN